jgi:hypothetical protein
MIKQGQQAGQNKTPSPDDQAKLARAELDRARTEEIKADVTGNTAQRQLEAVSLLKEKKATNY